ncbi:hypothetical protein MYSTI_03799 [Myxococcus stipitatus DSM 14675]|uniref:Lipoprotein n=1 Tax=Myxococcus stipitatus (strain DSM 14675 / JCM 12634 / Mx s8) TaxID=1278073 RepID=L7UB57_MYXSD|nr:hypothetical protein [Myxococcus stipitatus]AGC45105.1 hypothetical protein MYSTI_03799 [Myxococcus stipitatus DSM 14675]
MAGTTRTDIEMTRSFGLGGAALLAAMVLGSGCAKRVEAEPEARSATGDVADYYPLAIGNKWTYQLNGRADRSVTVEILKQEEGYFHDNQGGQFSVDAYGLRDPKRYLLRAPLRTGQAWTNVVSVSSTERYQIVQAGGSCETPAGTFPSCIEVEGRNRVDAKATLINTMTFAPGVGMVRLETAVETANQQRIPQTRLELVSYELKGGASSNGSPPAAR